MIPYAGWELPVQYTGVVQEHRATRNAVGLFDVGHMGRLRLEGERASEVVDSLITNGLHRAPPGKALYTCCCNTEGMILDDLIVYCMSPSEVWVVCNGANRTKISNHFQEHAQGKCQFEDFTDAMGLIAIQGPRALEVIVKAGGGEAVEQLAKFSVRRGRLGEVPVTVARTGYTGEDGVELFVPSSQIVGVWRRLVELSAPLGGGPVGLAARDTLRLEARLCLYGNELSESTHPFEAGLGWTVDFSKENFQGKQALQKFAAQELDRILVGFEMTGRGIARAGYQLYTELGKELGHCTSGSPAPTLGKSIGLGYVRPTHSAVGTSLLVDCRGRRISAQVVKTPFYRRSPKTGPLPEGKT